MTQEIKTKIGDTAKGLYPDYQTEGLFDSHKLPAFINGAEYGYSLSTNEERWVPVETEERPEDGEVVDTWNGIANRRAIYRKLATPEQSLFERHTDPHANERVYVLHFPDVTHWRKLPSPPSIKLK